MNEEYRSLLENDTWDLIPLPKGRKLVRCKWVCRTKFGPDGKIDKHKACLVVKGFSQVEGIDYTEKPSPLLPKLTLSALFFPLLPPSNGKSIRWMLNLPSCIGTCMKNIYMEQPPGFIQIDHNLACWRKKSLYGLVQAPRAWYAKMDIFLFDTGLSRCHFDNIVYTMKVGKSLIIIFLYVDDLILTGSDPNLINHVKSSLKNQFEMTNLGHLHYFLGLQVLQSKEGISLSHSKYVCDRLAEASPLLVGFTESNQVGVPDDRKSIAGYIITLGSGPITWACKKQSAISLSSAEAEYRGVIEASKEALWLCQILLEFGFQ
eukprot:PITA_32377